MAKVVLGYASIVIGAIIISPNSLQALGVICFTLGVIHLIDLIINETKDF